MPTNIKVLTLETRPLKKWDVEQDMPGEFCVKQVAIGVRNGIEFHINSMVATDPKSDCWFAVELSYSWSRRDGYNDSDTIITNGDSYFLCRRNLGETRMKLTPLVRSTIQTAIEEFVKSL